MTKIVTDRAVGRDSFLRLVAELILDPDWVASNLRLPRSYCLIVRGASRESLGESVCLQTDSTTAITIKTVANEAELLRACMHEEADVRWLCVWLCCTRGAEQTS